MFSGIEFRDVCLSVAVTVGDCVITWLLPVPWSCAWTSWYPVTVRLQQVVVLVDWLGMQRTACSVYVQGAVDVWRFVLSERRVGVHSGRVTYRVGLTYLHHRRHTASPLQIKLGAEKYPVYVCSENRRHTHTITLSWLAQFTVSQC